jgi:hypothetical protein
MKKITKTNMVKNFAIALFSLSTLAGCQKENVTPGQSTPVQPATHTIMLVNWSLQNVYLQNQYVDQSLNRDLMGRDDLFGRDTVILYTNEIEYQVKRNPKSNQFFSWADVRIALYDNGILRKIYERQGIEFYIRYQAN